MLYVVAADKNSAQDYNMLQDIYDVFIKVSRLLTSIADNISRVT